MVVICILLMLAGIFSLLIAGASISTKEFVWYKGGVSEGTKTILKFAPLIGIILFLSGVILIFR